MAKANIGDTGRKSEKRLAKQLGGRARPASGAMEGAKGDIDFDTVLMEAKSTTSGSLALKFEWLAKIAREALQVRKSPALAVSFTDNDGKAYPNGEWVLVPRSLWEERLK